MSWRCGFLCPLKIYKPKDVVMKVVGKEACLKARLCRLSFFIKVKAWEHLQTLNDREYPREKRYIYFIPRDKLSMKNPRKTQNILEWNLAWDPIVYYVINSQSKWWSDIVYLINIRYGINIIFKFHLLIILNLLWVEWIHIVFPVL